MRSGLIGVFLGVLLTLLVLALAQRILLRPVADDLSYRFSNYVFGETQFPSGDVEQGRLLRRLLLPVKVTTMFYDAGYHQVTQADKPGRYGAVVQIETNSGRVQRHFITLYRLPAKIFWEQTPLSITAQFPAEAGLDPALVRAQQTDIGPAIQNNLIDDDNNGAPGFAVLLASLSETSPADPPAVARTNAAARDAAWWYGLRQRLGLTETYPYLVDLPHDYNADSGKRWPLILFLDNAADRGTDPPIVRRSGLAGLVHDGRQLPAVLISPVCPEGEGWDTEILSHLLDEVEAKYCIDADRIYVSGISAGGDGAWALALAQPERFAAVVPICGESDPSDAARLVHLPLWAFHGLKDQIIPVAETVTMIQVIRQAGGHPHLTLFPDAGHNSWDLAYANEALYTWLFAQKRGQPEISTAGVPSP